MLPAIIIDPSTLWMIDEKDSVDDAKMYIQKSMEWMKPKIGGPIDLFLSITSIGELAKHGAFPSENRFRAVIKQLGLNGVVSPKSLATNVSRFIAGTAIIETELGLKDAIHLNTKIEGDPTKNIGTHNLRCASVAVFALAALSVHKNTRFSMYAFPRHANIISDVNVEAKFEIIELFEDKFCTDQNIANIIKVLSIPTGWWQGISPVDVWSAADCASDLEIAIHVAAAQNDQNSACGIHDFRVGSAFLDSLGRSGALREGPFVEAVLSKCAQTILRQSSLKPQPFRNGSRADAPPQVRARDGAVAWRQHVTKSHQGLRLMYWKLPDGQVEFSILGNKSDLYINEGEVLPPRTW